MDTIKEEYEKTLQEVIGITNQRGDRYGNIKDNSKIKINLYHSWRFNGLPYYIENAILSIFGKLSRVLSGDVTYDDNYKDIIGYALKANEAFIENKDNINIFPSNLLSLEKMLSLKQMYEDWVKNSKSFDKMNETQKRMIFNLLHILFFIKLEGHTIHADFTNTPQEMWDTITPCICLITFFMMKSSSSLGCLPTEKIVPFNSEKKKQFIFLCGEKCGGCQEMKPIIDKFEGKIKDYEVVTLDRHANKDNPIISRYEKLFAEKHLQGLPAYCLVHTSGEKYFFDGKFTADELIDKVDTWEEYQQ